MASSRKGLNHPAAGSHDRGEPSRTGASAVAAAWGAVLGEPQCRQGDTCLSSLALGRVHLAQGLLDALRLAEPYPGVQQERSRLGGECVTGGDPPG